MVSEDMLKVLKFIAQAFKKHDINWVLAGSISLALQGVDVEPHDIDIITTEEDALKLNNILKEYMVKKVEYSETPHFKSHYGKFKINNIEVEIMGNPKEKRGDKWFDLSSRLRNKNFVKLDELDLPVSSLEDHLESYMSSGREKDVGKVEKIKRRIEEIKASRGKD
ncbi:MAG: nucleotidyltransferase domain-containing protein [Candidatus Njordarchaeia archaeon]